MADIWDGKPFNPEREELYHWLEIDGVAVPWCWGRDEGASAACWLAEDGEGITPRAMARHATYGGVCLPPDKLREIVTLFQNRQLVVTGFQREVFIGLYELGGGSGYAVWPWSLYRYLRRTKPRLQKMQVIEALDWLADKGAVATIERGRYAVVCDAKGIDTSGRGHDLRS